MRLKSVRHLIYSPIILVINDSRVPNITNIMDVSCAYDNYEVIGIRALNDKSTYFEDTIVISLKEVLNMSSFESFEHSNSKINQYSNYCSQKED